MASEGADPDAGGGLIGELHAIRLELAAIAADHPCAAAGIARCRERMTRAIIAARAATLSQATPGHPGR